MMMPTIKLFIKKRLPFVMLIIARVRHHLSKRTIRRILRERSEIFVEVGAGDKRGQGKWVTIDVTRNCDIYWDLRNGLPFPDDRIKKIYSSHFLEHLSFVEGQQFLNECKRVLVQGGKFLICVPNARIYLEAYVKGISLDTEKFFVWKPAYNGTTRIDYVNYTAYMGSEQKYMFDEENLLYILKAKGFKNCRLRQFDPSLDLQARDYESIYAEGEK